jgi:hypothetical protein
MEFLKGYFSNFVIFINMKREKKYFLNEKKSAPKQNVEYDYLNFV